MSAMPVLVIGLDAAWRARMQRLLAMRGELDWLGAFAPAEKRVERAGTPALLLLDGDDPTVERERRKPQLPAPRRLYFYRHPNVSALQHGISPETVKTHLHHVFEREGVHGRMALLAAHLNDAKPQ